MPTGQGKAKRAVIEVAPIGIQPIVTIQAGHPKCDSVVEHEGLVRLLVTVAADR